MASRSSIAKTKDRAYLELRESAEKIASALGVQIPNLETSPRYGLEYRQAMELSAIAAFLTDVAESLDKQKARPNLVKKAV